MDGESGHRVARSGAEDGGVAERDVAVGDDDEVLVGLVGALASSLSEQYDVMKLMKAY